MQITSYKRLLSYQFKILAKNYKYIINALSEDDFSIFSVSFQDHPEVIQINQFNETIKICTKRYSYRVFPKTQRIIKYGYNNSINPGYSYAKAFISACSISEFVDKLSKLNYALDPF